jgi:hypothetical protein
MPAGATVFRSPPAWGGAQIAAASVALVVALWWLKSEVVEPDFGMVMGWLGACLAGPVTLLWAGSWSELRIDPPARTVVSRIGFLGWSAGPSYALADFDRVLVVPTIDKGQEVVNVVGGGFNTKSTRTSYKTRHSLQLRGALHHATVPLPLAASLAEIEAAAHQVAELGGWKAMRQAWVPRPGTGEFEAVEVPLVRSR